MFFGQYLLQKRKINVEQLRQALELVQRVRISFSQLAVERGALSALDANRLELEEVESNCSLRQLVVDFGLLSEDEAKEIGIELEKRQLRLGEALIRLGYLKAGELSGLLASFHAQNVPNRTEAVALPGTLGSNPLAAYVVDFLPPMVQSVSDLTLRIDSANTYGGQALQENIVSLGTLGTDAVCVTLSGDNDFAQALLPGRERVGYARPNRAMLEGALGDLLNILVGNAVVAYEQDGGSSELAFPDYGKLPPHTGYHFDLACTVGEVQMVIAER